MRNLILSITLLLCGVSYGQYKRVDWNTQDNCQHQMIIYYDNGQIKEVGCYNNDLKKTGQWYMYALNGERIALSGFDHHGKKHGEWMIWDDQGELKAHMIYEHGKRTGVWKAYLSDGTVQKRKYKE
mgnify:CR=1 FL=1